MVVEIKTFETCIAEREPRCFLSSQGQAWPLGPVQRRGAGREPLHCFSLLISSCSGQMELVLGFFSVAPPAHLFEAGVSLLGVSSGPAWLTGAEGSCALALAPPWGPGPAATASPAGYRCRPSPRSQVFTSVLRFVTRTTFRRLGVCVSSSEKGWVVLG